MYKDNCISLYLETFLLFNLYNLVNRTSSESFLLVAEVILKVECIEFGNALTVSAFTLPALTLRNKIGLSAMALSHDHQHISPLVLFCFRYLWL